VEWLARDNLPALASLCAQAAAMWLSCIQKMVIATPPDFHHESENKGAIGRGAGGCRDTCRPKGGKDGRGCSKELPSRNG